MLRSRTNLGPRGQAMVVMSVLAVALTGLAEPVSAGPMTGAGPTQADAAQADAAQADTAQASRAAPTALRRAMTWTVVGQQGGHVHVGYDAQTNAYTGDTTIDQYRPLLCLLVDGRAAPGGITFDVNNGWARGAVRATTAVRGDVLTSQARGDQVCAQNFGAGWRLAEFHDGRYGPGFALRGGWSFWAAAGQLIPGARYWVAINDQPANPWNSAGDLPPPVQLPPDDVIVQTRLQEIMPPLLTFARNPAFRGLVNAGVARQFDGDTNVLLADVIRDAEAAGLVDPNSPSWRSIKDTVTLLQTLNEGYQPQVYIPNHGDGAVPGADVTMVLTGTDTSRTDVPAYHLDAAGTLRVRPGTVNEDYSELHELWVLSINEGPDTAGATAAGTKAAAEAFDAGIRTGDAGTMAICTANGLRLNRGQEYLSKIMLPSLREVAGWLDGKVELRMVVIGKGGLEVKNHRFPKIKRKKLKNQAWLDLETFIATWDRTDLGDYWGYQWYEVSKGPHLQSITLSPSTTWVEKLRILPGMSISISVETRFKSIGSALVGFRESTTQQYSTGFVRWYVCSTGGVEENLAILATASASSTYPVEPYSPARVNDGSRSTALGPTSSWVNAGQFAPNGFLPQWVQLDFGVPTTFNTVVVYTTQGFQLRDYQIQILNALGNWQPVSVRTGNTADMVLHQLGQNHTARFVRVWGTLGPAVQPGYARVNELEVYLR